MNSMQHHCRKNSVVKPLSKLFSVKITCCCFSVSSCCFFLLYHLTITPKDDISNVTFLCNIQTSLHLFQFLEIPLSATETPRGNGFRMTKNRRKCPLSENKDKQAVRNFVEKNHLGDNLHANRKKIY